ncbi:MAG TPA: wax ester/triacylglycerol synthase family O-acyltransferase [Jiangellales bacterium]|jgi:diacylglycerol O-acyltransferase / wax synthase|nr:wax ester/triacylglycerol synthase family O-acyltransferase [Jiangellales bacterium]
MTGKRPIGAVDTIWLNMDRPDNLMVIDAVMWFDEPVDWERLEQVLLTRLVQRYPVFSQRPAGGLPPLTQPHWEDDEEFSLDHHLCRVTLPPPGDEAALQAYVESQAHRPLDRSRPLWEFHLIDGFGAGAAVLCRFHHALADGIALAQVLLSLTDPTPTSDLEVAVEEDAPAPAARGVLAAASRVTGSATSAVRGSLHLLADLPHLVDPRRFADALTLAQQTGHVMDKLLLGSLPATPLTGVPGIEKRTVWSAPHDLGAVKGIGRLSGATVNDVLIAALSSSLSSYVLDRGGEPADLTTMVPVNLRPLDRPLPRELGNRFALVLLPLPTGAYAPLLRLAEAKRRMDAIKTSPEAILTFGLITAIGRTNPEIERVLVDFFSGKAFGVTTNVMGPREVRYVAGSRLAGVLGWVPGSGHQTVGVSIFTYDGTVRVGFKVDAGVVTHPEALVHGVDEALDELQRMASAV